MDSIRVIASMLRYAYGGQNPEGKLDYCWVTQVTPDSKASKAGIKPGDDIIELDGASVLKMTRLEFDLKLAQELKPGEQRVLTFKSKGKIKSGETGIIQLTFVGKKRDESVLSE